MPLPTEMHRQGFNLWPGLGVLFLLLQLGLIVRARFVPERFFCWAPFDESSVFKVEVSVGKRALTAAEVARRYQYRSSGWQNHSMHNVIAMIRQYERSYGKGDGARVMVTYSLNGRPAQPWVWPEP